MSVPRVEVNKLPLPESVLLSSERAVTTMSGNDRPRLTGWS